MSEIKFVNSKVEFVDKMGTDLSVVNAARVSFDKHVDTFEARDEKLIKYLADHNHFTPFCHATMTIRVKAPIFVARQLHKHQIGLTVNEVSRRYVDTPPEFYKIDEFRGKPVNKKQGSSDDVITSVEGEDPIDIYRGICWLGLCAYNSMIDAGVCPEQARAMLPLSAMTEWYWTGSIFAFARVCNLRIKPDAQKESREVVEDIKNILEIHFPVATKSLT